MAAVTLGTLVYFRRKGWIGNREPELPEDKPRGEKTDRKPAEPPR
jgi:hypothetical protein